MALQPNSKLLSEVAQTPCPVNYTTAAGSDPLRVQYLIDLVSAETVDGVDAVNRGFMDEMSAIARVTLVSHLTALKAAVS